MSQGLVERRRELEVLCDIAREAGRAIVASAAQDRMPSYKAGGKVVTGIDRRVNELIRARLRAAFPGEPIVAEESAPESYLGFAAAVIGLGSAGLKGARVADGSADAFVAVGVAGKRWDVCAIDAVVSAAGGRVTDTWGQRMNYRRATLDLSCGIIAANSALHRILVEHLASVTGWLSEAGRCKYCGSASGCANGACVEAVTSIIPDKSLCSRRVQIGTASALERTSTPSGGERQRDDAGSS